MLRFGCFPVFVMSIAPWVSTSALEADSVVLIDQASAIAGGVTPDAPGFPVTLSQRGSYRLTSNLDIDDPNATAIEITADYVTLDLDGFAITGPADLCEGRLVPVWCSTETQGVGVFASPFLVGPVVLNGTVRAMGSDGVNLGSSARVEKLNVSDNRRHGIRVVTGIVADSIVASNGVFGVWIQRGILTGNTVHSRGQGSMRAVEVSKQVTCSFNYLTGQRSDSPAGRDLRCVQVAPNVCHDRICT